MIVTSDDSCDPNKKICTSSALNSVQSLCGGKESCSTYAGSVKLANCQNKIASVWQIDYTCIPDKIDSMPPKEFCEIDGQGNLNNVLLEEKGLIQTPTYPNQQKNIDCSLVYRTPSNSRMLISIYIVSSDLENNWNLACNDGVAFYQINGGEKFCGKQKPRLVEQFCSDNFNVNVKIGAKEYGGLYLS